LYATQCGGRLRGRSGHCGTIANRSLMTHIGHVACNRINGRYERAFAMTKVRVAGFSVSLDGFGAGPEQSLENPLGKRGRELHTWFMRTRSFQAMFGKSEGAGGVDDEYAHRAMDGFGAFILGRNMFGPIRGPWPDESWKGWWGNNPPYHAPTFV